MRTDRAVVGTGEFSLLLLERVDERWSGPASDRALELLLTRVRLTDEVGWFEPGVLGVILPETTEEGARRLAVELQELLRADGLEASLRIYAYPHDEGFGGDDDDPEDPSTPSDQEAESRNGRSHPAPPKMPVRTGGPVAAEQPATSLRTLFLRPPSRVKRALDVAGSGLGLLLLAPLFLVVAVLVWVSSPGPIIFRQKRVGLGGRKFWFYKFRTMYVDAEERKKELLHRNEQSGPVFKMRDDPRITPIGKLLRKTSIDELPQLWNVLRGDMSLVGPRPPVPQEVALYAPWQRRRLEVPGGLTCVWQVSGRSEIPFEEWVRMDLDYGSRFSLTHDLQLLARTIPAVLSARGAR